MQLRVGWGPHARRRFADACPTTARRRIDGAREAASIFGSRGAGAQVTCRLFREMSPMFASASVRQPAVAGLFYPLDSGKLRDTVSKLLEDTAAKQLPATPQAFIVPHAGYIYSGGTAASAYALIAAHRGKVNKVVLVGPSHRVYLNGVALPEAGAFATPLGIVPIDAELHNELKNYPGVIESDQPHRFEHSLEVQLPFLQMVLGEFSLVPLVAGIAPAALIASVMARAWQDPQTLVIASSDLS